MALSSSDELPNHESDTVAIDSLSPPEGNDNYFSQKDIELTKTTNEAPVWNILPSYHMYTTSIYKSLNVSNESLTEPPSYESSSIYSNGHSPSLSTRLSDSVPTQDSVEVQTNESTENNDRYQRLIVADETSSLWQETVLDNIHKLTNLTYSNRVVSNAVKLSIEFTKEVGELGKKPILIDPLLHEYKQGDLINGFVMITNECDEPIPFDMFYVLFEGNFAVANNLDIDDMKSVKIQKFLQMFDFSASWNYAHINRLITEYENPYNCPSIKDPYDGTNLGIGKGRKLLPNVRYKRFFTFKIPEHLLDSECDHSLVEHTQVPPTLGVSRAEHHLNAMNKSKTSKAKDISFVGTSISYSVQARFIGRGSKYNFSKSTRNKKDTLINSRGDEYVILKELNKFLRIVPQRRNLSPNEKEIKEKGSEMLYKDLVNRSKEKIEIGYELLKSIDTNEMDNATDLVSKLSSHISADFNDQVKFRQLYRSSNSIDCKRNLCYDEEEANKKYNLISPYTRKSITGSVKQIGTLQVSSPKLEYTLKYIPPAQFRNGEHVNQSDLKTWDLKVPVVLTFRISRSLFEKNKKFPIIKSIRSDLVVLTIKSIEHPIPIEIIHDLLFKNELSSEIALNDHGYRDLDDFSTIVKTPFKKYFKELLNIFHKLPPDVFRLETKLLKDIKCLSSIAEKHMNLQIEDMQYQVPGEQQQSINSKNLSKMKWAQSNSECVANENANQLVYDCKFDLFINVVSAHLKVIGQFKKANAFDTLFLVPSFQSCYMGRFYYVKIDITFTNGDIVHLKVPADFEK